MADVVQLTCWETPDHPALGIRIKTLSGEAYSSVESKVQIDTGYSEEILMPYWMFQMLNLIRFRANRQKRGSTVTGEQIVFIEARVLVEIPRIQREEIVVVQTFKDNIRFLIGRQFLRRYKLILDGPGQQTCLMVSI